MASLLSNLSWKFAERGASQIVSFIVSIILARILDPTDYGVIAMVMIFIQLANVIVEGGFSSALIQKKNADRLDFSTVFYFSLLLSVILYIILYISAPYVSIFYGDGYEILTPVLRVLGIQVIILAINSVQQAYVSRKMLFQKFFWSTLVGTVVSAIVGLICAYIGCGIWSLVWQQLTMSVVNTLTLYLVTRKLPGCEFSFVRLKGLFSYGSKILGASLLISLYMELRSLIIGKLYTAKDLAFFDKGRQFPSLLVTNINSSIASVLFPKMSQNQDKIDSIKVSCRNSIRFSSYIMSPLMFGLAACSESLIRLLLTDKWLPCVPLLQLFCIIYMFYPMHTANMQAIKAIGRSDIFLKLEIFKKSIELISLLLVMRVSVNAIVINMAVITTIFTFVNAIPNQRLLNYSFKEQMLDILPPIGMSFIMFVVIWFIGKIAMPDLPLLILQITLGAILYIVMSIASNNSEFKYIFSLLRKFKV